MTYLHDHVRALVDAIRGSRDLIFARESWETTLRTRSTADAHTLASLVLEPAARLEALVAPRQVEVVVLSGDTEGVVVKISDSARLRNNR